MNLQQAIEEIHRCGGRPDLLAENDALLDYLEETVNEGGNILKQLSETELNGACSLMMSLSVADLLSDGELGVVMFLMSKPDVFLPLMAVMLRVSVGLTAKENWLVLR